jgi:hypothetical protein
MIVTVRSGMSKSTVAPLGLEERYAVSRPVILPSLRDSWFFFAGLPRGYHPWLLTVAPLGLDEMPPPSDAARRPTNPNGVTVNSQG